MSDHRAAHEIPLNGCTRCEHGERQQQQQQLCHQQRRREQICRRGTRTAVSVYRRPLFGAAQVQNERAQENPKENRSGYVCVCPYIIIIFFYNILRALLMKREREKNEFDNNNNNTKPCNLALISQRINEFFFFNRSIFFPHTTRVKPNAINQTCAYNLRTCPRRGCDLCVPTNCCSRCPREIVGKRGLCAALRFSRPREFFRDFSPLSAGAAIHIRAAPRDERFNTVRVPCT